VLARIPFGRMTASFPVQRSGFASIEDDLEKKLGTSVIPSHMEALSQNGAGVGGRTRRTPVLSRKQAVDQRVQNFCDNDRR
jgi:hypothetical protein